MKPFTVTILLFFIAFLCMSGCRKEPEKLNVTFIEEKLNDFNDVDAFVTWLKNQRGVTNVTHNKLTFLTSDPPQHVVNFSLNGVENRLLLMVEADVELKLVKPTSETVEQYQIP